MSENRTSKNVEKGVVGIIASAIGIGVATVIDQVLKQTTGIDVPDETQLLIISAVTGGILALVNFIKHRKK